MSRRWGIGWRKPHIKRCRAHGGWAWLCQYEGDPPMGAVGMTPMHAYEKWYACMDTTMRERRKGVAPHEA